MRGVLIATFALAAMLGVASSASADFIGQTILGPLSNGSSVNGNTSLGSTDDNDGWDSGIHIFDIWNGPDDVWILPWVGGDLALEMLYDNSGFTDLDLFLYEPGQYDSTGIYSIINTGVENIEYPAAPAGDYYIVVDSPAGGDGAYTLNVTPEPGTLALLGLGLAAIARRRRPAQRR